MGAADSSWEPSPSYSEFLTGTRDFVLYNIEYLKHNYSFPSDLIRDYNICYSNLDNYVIPSILLLAVGWTLLRHYVTLFLFKPIGSVYLLPREEREKLPESLWKFLFYSLSWAAEAYIIFGKEDSQYFQRPSTIWKDYSMDTVIPMDIFVIYIIQLSFYIHSVYATICLDHWRKDSLVLIGHHVITSVMLLFSLSTKCHRAGLGIIFLHDVCDILLEGTKTSLYFKKQGKKFISAFEVAANVGFVCFSLTWFVSRLYWFPLRSLYMASVYLLRENIEIPFTFFINCLLYILLLMNIYWFSFILNLLYKVVTGQIELEDVRELEEDEAEVALDSEKSHKESKGQLEVEETSAEMVLKDMERSKYFLRQRKETSGSNNGRSQ